MGFFLEWPNQHKRMKKLDKSLQNLFIQLNIFTYPISCKNTDSKYLDV